jgi:hypothetical protein
MVNTSLSAAVAARVGLTGGSVVVPLARVVAGRALLLKFRNAAVQA